MHPFLPVLGDLVVGLLRRLNTKPSQRSSSQFSFFPTFYRSSALLPWTFCFEFSEGSMKRISVAFFACGLQWDARSSMDLVGTQTKPVPLPFST